jgi:hypothetical protein
MTNIVPPIKIDGVDYYVMVCSPRGAAQIHGAGAASEAEYRFAGRNWRRVKREMKRAHRRAKAEYWAELKK